MIKKTEIFIGLRYLRSKKSNGFASFISMVSLIGITLGVASLITILSVMNGFESELRDRLLSMSYHGSIKNVDENWQELHKKIIVNEDIIAASPLISFDAVVRSERSIKGIKIHAVIPDYEKEVVGKKINFIAGDLNKIHKGSNAILLGSDLAYSLNVSTGDDLILMIPVANNGSIDPVLATFKVKGFFKAGIQEYDSVLALVNYNDAEEMVSANRYSQLRYISKNPMLAPAISKALAESLGENYISVDWTDENSAFFGAIKLEKIMMTSILFLVIGVATFNIVASLIMVVTDKKTDIAVLRTLGMSANSIKNVFFIQGSMIGFFGVSFGVFIGCLIASNVPEWAPKIEEFFGFQIMPGDVFYMSEIPSVLLINDVFYIGLISYLITLLATYYPASIAAKVEPAVALRYE